MQAAGYCECGCGERTRIATRTNRSNGEVEGVPMRFVHGHNARPRLESRYTVADDGCWLWLGKKNQHGYGRARYEGRDGVAHRMVYETLVGPVPKGMVLDHLCRNKACVNPAHLEPVTQGDNVRRGRGTKLTEEQVSAIRASVGTNVAVAARFGVSAAYVSRLRSGKARGDIRDFFAAG